MKFVDEFRDPKLAKELADKIAQAATKPLKFMEVCGTHTMSIARYGIKTMLPENVKLISGPGCPVCVTPQNMIDMFIDLGHNPDMILTSFGDMIRVPGSKTNLEYERAKGADVRIVYSPMDALIIAEHNPDKKVIFFGVGFETTTPAVALAVIGAKKRNINNFFVLSAHKVIPPAMDLLAQDPEIAIDGFLCPGHVSAITGTGIYEKLVDAYHIPCVVTGFEPLDILQAILLLVKQAVCNRAEVEIQYTRSVSSKGNKLANQTVYEVFETDDSDWRGIGIIPSTGLKFRREYAAFDALQFISAKDYKSVENKVCECGSILKGIKTPSECRAFGKACTPDNPLGPCMVSSEGSCAAEYRYSKI